MVRIGVRNSVTDPAEPLEDPPHADPEEIYEIMRDFTEDQKSDIVAMMYGNDKFYELITEKVVTKGLPYIGNYIRPNKSNRRMFINKRDKVFYITTGNGFPRLVPAKERMLEQTDALKRKYREDH
jgi:hypothetical protein